MDENPLLAARYLLALGEDLPKRFNDEVWDQRSNRHVAFGDLWRMRVADVPGNIAVDLERLSGRRQILAGTTSATRVSRANWARSSPAVHTVAAALWDRVDDLLSDGEVVASMLASWESARSSSSELVVPSTHTGSLNPQAGRFGGVPRALAVTVNREHELHAGVQALQAARVLNVHGEPGVGKTWISADIAAQISAGGSVTSIFFGNQKILNEQLRGLVSRGPIALPPGQVDGAVLRELAAETFASMDPEHVVVIADGVDSLDGLDMLDRFGGKLILTSRARLPIAGRHLLVGNLTDSEARELLQAHGFVADEVLELATAVSGGRALVVHQMAVLLGTLDHRHAMEFLGRFASDPARGLNSLVGTDVDERLLPALYAETAAALLTDEDLRQFAVVWALTTTRGPAVRALVDPILATLTSPSTDGSTSIAKLSRLSWIDVHDEVIAMHALTRSACSFLVTPFLDEALHALEHVARNFDVDELDGGRHTMAGLFIEEARAANRSAPRSWGDVWGFSVDGSAWIVTSAGNTALEPGVYSTGTDTVLLESGSRRAQIAGEDLHVLVLFVAHIAHAVSLSEYGRSPVSGRRLAAVDLTNEPTSLLHVHVSAESSETTHCGIDRPQRSPDVGGALLCRDCWRVGEQPWLDKRDAAVVQGIYRNSVKRALDADFEWALRGLRYLSDALWMPGIAALKVVAEVEAGSLEHGRMEAVRLGRFVTLASESSARDHVPPSIWLALRDLIDASDVDFRSESLTPADISAQWLAGWRVRLLESEGVREALDRSARNAADDDDMTDSVAVANGLDEYGIYRMTGHARRSGNDPLHRYWSSVGSILGIDRSIDEMATRPENRDIAAALLSELVGRLNTDRRVASEVVARSQFNLALIFLQDGNDELAVRAFRLASKFGYPPARDWLIRHAEETNQLGLQEETLKAWDLLTQARSAGSSALVELGTSVHESDRLYGHMCWLTAFEMDLESGIQELASCWTKACIPSPHPDLGKGVGWHDEDPRRILRDAATACE